MKNVIVSNWNVSHHTEKVKRCKSSSVKGAMLFGREERWLLDSNEKILVWKKTIEIGPCEGKSPLGENEEKRESFSGEIFIDTLVWLFRVYNVAA